MLKQNKPPTKQGAFYELNLGKNNGPFLSKDIMYNNRKSMTLLSNKNILKSHQTMVNTIKNLDKSRNDLILSPEKVQNFNGMIDYCKDQIRQFDIVSNSMKIEQNLLHRQLEQMNKRITLSITQLYESSMPGIKLFLKKVKQTNNSDKQENYQLKRQLERISQQSSILKKGLTQCENKIQILQKMFINQKDTSAQNTKNSWTY